MIYIINDVRKGINTRKKRKKPSTPYSTFVL